MKIAMTVSQMLAALAMLHAMQKEVVQPAAMASPALKQRLVTMALRMPAEVVTPTVPQLEKVQPAATVRSALNLNFATMAI
jgi:hypothetical protein